MSIVRLEREFGLEPGSIGEINELAGAERYRTRHLGNRTIHIPCHRLMDIQRAVARHVGTMVEPHPAAYGYVRGCSIIGNARCHTRKNFVLSFDAENFFGSITRTMIARNLADIMGWSTGVTDIVADLCCYDGVLPQGSPASPLISNLVCIPLDERLQAIADRFRGDYSRWSDDMTISTHSREFPTELATATGWGRCRITTLGGVLAEAVEDQGFRINSRKTRLQPRESQQIVTGLTVNDGVNVPRVYLQRLRAILNTWTAYGLETVVLDFVDREPRTIPNVVRSMIEYVGQVRGRRNAAYVALRSQFRALEARDSPLIL
jgi:RNA-directed DNA polymerase